MTTGETIPAHGGRLIDLLVTGDEAKSLRERAAGLPAVALNSRSLSDVEL
ncbi:MAG: sulfate adenylyltransferase, partial [Chloroflexi bacterium]